MIIHSEIIKNEGFVKQMRCVICHNKNLIKITFINNKNIYYCKGCGTMKVVEV